MYGPLIIGYLFLGGTAAAGLLITAVQSLFFVAKRHGVTPWATAPGRAGEGVEAFFRRGYLVSWALLLFAMVMLFFDLGRPGQALLVFLNLRRTVISFGAVCLALEALVGALLVAATTFKVSLLQGRVQVVLNLICCLVSPAVMGYTALFLMSNVGISLWSTWTLVPLFVFSSLSCGLALVMLLDHFFKDLTLAPFVAAPLHKAHVISAVLELVSLVLFAVITWLNPQCATAVQALLQPKMLMVVSVGVLGMGILAPLAAEVSAVARRDYRPSAAACALGLVGGVLLRYCIIVCGVY